MKKRKLVSMLMAAVVGAASLAAGVQAAPSDLAAQTEQTVAFAKESSWALDDWTVFALGRHQASGCEELFEQYCQETAQLLDSQALEEPEVRLYCADYIRISVALTAIGVDPRNMEGHNLLQTINDRFSQEASGLSTSTLAYLLALTQRYPEVFSEDVSAAAAQQILAVQQDDGSFLYIVGAPSLGDEYYTPDPDSTAQAMQGLMLLGGAYDEEIEKAAAFLKTQMDETGAVVSFGAANPSSTAQTLIAFSQKGEEPVNSQGKSLYDGLMTFSLGDGSFKDIDWSSGGTDMAYNEYASGQCLQALVAYQRMAQGLSPLFDLSDAQVSARPEPEEETEPSVSSKPSEEPVSSQTETSSEEVPSGENLDTPKTGDIGLGAILVLGLAAAGAAVALGRKKK